MVNFTVQIAICKFLKSEKLIVEIPMKTYNKTRYATGDKLELLPKGSKPEYRGLFTVNAWTIANIATQLAQEGYYTAEEEAAEEEAEAEMVHPAMHYGSSINMDARPDSETLDEAKRNQIRTLKAIRDVSVYGEKSIYSALTNLSVFLDRDTSEESEDSEAKPPPTTEESSKPKEKKEQITSKTSILMDGSVSEWSDLTDNQSWATTATLMPQSQASVTPIRSKIDQNLAAKGKIPLKDPAKVDPVIVENQQDNVEKYSVRASLMSKKMSALSMTESSLPDSTLVPDESDLLNQARILEETLEDIQEETRKRPKGLLLG